MKLSFALLLLSLFACKSSSIVKMESVNLKISKSIETHCPENGNCYFTVKNNVFVKINQDSTGALYPIFPDGNSVVLGFEYKRNEEANTADGGYQELLYLELNKDKMEVDLKDSELTKVNLLFGRLCFCRGQSGYYKIKQGHLKVTKTAINNEFLLTLNFKTDNVPQVITNISEKFLLD